MHISNKLFKKGVILLALYLGLIIFLLVTNPNKLTISWLILPFVWLFVCLFLTILLAMDILHYRPARINKRLSIAVLIAVVPTIALLLDSINQLTVRDALLIIIFGIVAIFYTSKLEIGK